MNGILIKYFFSLSDLLPAVATSMVYSIRWWWTHIFCGWSCKLLTFHNNINWSFSSVPFALFKFIKKRFRLHEILFLLLLYLQEELRNRWIKSHVFVCTKINHFNNFLRFFLLTDYHQHTMTAISLKLYHKQVLTCRT